MRRLLPLLLLLLASACGEQAAPLLAVDVAVRVESEARRVAPAQGFALTLTRTWRKELQPAPWDDGLLSPLVLRAPQVSRREDGTRIEETRRWRAYVFGLDDVTVPAVPFAARPADGGELRLAASRPLRLRVEPELDPAQPGAPEPHGLLPRRRVPWLLLGGLAVLLGGAALVARRRGRTRPGSTAPAEVPGGAERRALASLEVLRAVEGAGPAERLAALAEVLRRYVGEVHHVPAHARTTPELLRLEALGAFLEPADRVKFAGAEPEAAEAEAVLDEAVALLCARAEGVA